MLEGIVRITMYELKNQVAVITGAASGLGYALALLAVECGMKVVLADIDVSGLQKLEEEIIKNKGEVFSVRCDVSKLEEVERLATVTIEKFGKVNMVFNNAGVGLGGLMWEHSISDWEWVLGVNMWGVIHGIKSFIPKMLLLSKQINGYRGYMVNTASMAGLINAPVMGVYNASKQAVVTFSETFLADLRLVNGQIDVSVLCPHFVPTQIHQSERNRPLSLQNTMGMTASQRAAQDLAKRATQKGKLSAMDVARITLNAVLKKQFYIVPHQDVLPSVMKRMEGIVKQTDFKDAFEETPHIREMLKSAIASEQNGVLF